MKVKRIKILSLILCIGLSASLFTACSFGESSEPVFMLKELPDIGVYKTAEEKSYYHSGPVGEFLSSDKYGEIVPFVSSIKQFTALSGEETAAGKAYGFVTLDGKIIVDGLYSNIQLLTSKSGKTVYIADKITKTAEDTSYLTADSITHSCDIIALDGSWKISVSSVSYSLSDPKDYIETADENGNLVLYDFSGKKIFDTASTMSNDKITSVYYAKDGKFIFEVSTDINTTKLVCVNENGELLTDINTHGYQVLKMINGVFIVFDKNDSNSYNLSDLNGNILLDKNFNLINYDNVNKCFICINDDEKEIFRYDTSGALINSLKIDCKGEDIKYILSGEDGVSIICKVNKKYRLYSTVTGEETPLDLKNLANGLSSFSPIYMGENEEYLITAERKDGTVDLYNAFGTYITSFSDYAGALGRTPDGGYCYKSKEGKFVVRSHTPINDFEISFDSKKISDYEVSDFDEKYISFLCADAKSGEVFYNVYDVSNQELVFEKLTDFESFSIDGERYYCVVQANESKLINADGTEIIYINSDKIF